MSVKVCLSIEQSHSFSTQIADAQPNNQPMVQQENAPTQQPQHGQQPQYGQYGPPPDPQQPPPVRGKKKSSMDQSKKNKIQCMAITGIIFGCLGVFSLGLPFGIAAIVLGSVALCTYEERGGGGCGHCMAAASIPLGLLAIAGMVFMVMIFTYWWNAIIGEAADESEKRREESK